MPGWRHEKFEKCILPPCCMLCCFSAACPAAICWFAGQSTLKMVSGAVIIHKITQCNLKENSHLFVWHWFIYFFFKLVRLCFFPLDLHIMSSCLLYFLQAAGDTIKVCPFFFYNFFLVSCLQIFTHKIIACGLEVCLMCGWLPLEVVWQTRSQSGLNVFWGYFNLHLQCCQALTDCNPITKMHFNARC